MADGGALIVVSELERHARGLIDARISPETKRAYHADLTRWLRFCAVTGAAPEAPTIEQATVFRDQLAAGASAATVRRALSALSFLYKRLVILGVAQRCPFFPAALAWPPGSSVGKTPAVRYQDALAMIQAASADDDPVRAARDTAILWLLTATGLRRASVAALQRKGLRDEGDGSTLALVVVKGSHEEETRIPPRAADALRRWLSVAAASPYVFPGRGAKPINVSVINKIITQRAKEAEIDHVTPHQFRAAFITDAYDAGVAERHVQAAAHHSDPRTTQRYDRKRRGLSVATDVDAFRSKRTT